MAHQGDGMTVTQSDVNANPAAPKSDRRLGERDLAEMLIIALIAAQVIRFVAAIAGGVVHGTFVLPGESYRQSLGVAVQGAADYADGQGVLILLAALGLTWWQLERWSNLRYDRRPTSGDDDLRPVRIADIHLRRNRRFAIAIAVNLFLAAVGASVYTVGTVLVQSGTGLSQVAASVSLANGGFNLAYAVIAVPAAVVALLLRSRRDSIVPAATYATVGSNPGVWAKPVSDGETEPDIQSPGT